MSEGIYTYERQHPPLSRILIALGPYLSGLRSLGNAGMYNEGWALIDHSPDPDRTVALARAGNLPFFWVMGLGTWLWAAHYYGRFAAALSVLLLAATPSVLGHAGLATTDISVTALMVLALFFLTRWMEAPSLALACAFGFSAGLALGSKFTSIPFIIAAGACLAAFRWLVERPRWSLESWAAPGATVRVAASFGCLMFALWACFGFGFHLEAATVPAYRPHVMLDGIVGSAGALHNFAYSIVESPVYPTFVIGVVGGLGQAVEHYMKGHPAFLFGEISIHGWWHYYPVALLVKSQLPLLALAAIGSAALLRRAFRTGSFVLAAPVVAFAAILAFCMTSTINIGVRHVLIIYPLLCIAAGAWLTTVFESRARILSGVSAALVAWQVAGAAVAYPNYLAYFNVLAGDAPQEVLLDSNLDWGQDFNRLKAEVSKRGIEKVHVSIFGHALAYNELPAAVPLRQREPVSGWVAISLTKLALARDAYAWLGRFKPVTLIGNSILLYHIDPDQLR